MLNDISQKITETLQALRDEETNELLFSAVYDYPINYQSEQIARYPIAIVVESGGTSDYLSNKENFRTYKYEVHILFSSKNSTMSAEWYKLRKATDVVMDAIDDDWQLGNEVIDVEPVDVNFGLDKHDSSGIEVSSVVLLNCKIDRTNAT